MSVCLSVCVSACLFVPNDLANHWTDMVLLYSVAFHRSFYFHPPKRNGPTIEKFILIFKIKIENVGVDLSSPLKWP